MTNDEYGTGLYDLAAIFALNEAFAALDPTDGPRATVAIPAPPARAIGILAGSFDPLTNAHLALTRAALGHGGVDTVYFALSRHTVNKESRQRPTDVDRALVLRDWLRGQPRHGLLLFNRGLYADQALAAREAFPEAATIRCIVGFDKAKQIFDPRYYSDRDAALRILFGACELLVAPRAGEGAGDLDALLSQPANAPFRASVRALPFDPAYADDSSTVVREALCVARPVDSLAPPATLAFVREAAPYTLSPADSVTPDRYDLRVALIAALAADATWATQHADLRALLDLATADTIASAALRAWLATEHAERTPPTLREWLAALR